MTYPGPGGGLSGGIDSNREYEIKRIMAEDAIAQHRAAIEQKTLDRAAKMKENLTNSFLEVMQNPDDETTKALHSANVDAFAAEMKALRGRPVSPVYTGFLKNNPDQALKMYQELEKQGIHPATHFMMANDPLMFQTGIQALQSAYGQMRKRRAGAEGDGGGSAAPTDTSASPTQTPSGSGISAPAAGGGVIQSSQPFGPAATQPAPAG